ncbi:MAG: AraC family transcriptional regulator, partial [Pseudomonadota bacterium]
MARAFDSSIAMTNLNEVREQSFEGKVCQFDFRPGFSLFYSDLNTLQDIQMDGSIGRSLHIVWIRGKGVSRFEFSNGCVTELETHHTYLVTVPDRASMTGIYEGKQQLKSIRLSIAPDKMDDQNLRNAFNEFLLYPRAIALPIVIDKHKVNALVTKESNNELANHLIAESISLELVSQLLSIDLNTEFSIHDKLSSRDLVNLHRARDLMLDDPFQAFRLLDLAETVGMSATSFKTKFLVLFGTPVIAYLRTIKLNIVRNKIENKELSIKQAASLAGYRHT